VRRVAGIALCLAIAAGTAACGGSGSGQLGGMDANQITMKAFANLKAASSVHVTGPTNENGLQYNLNVTLGATNCQGTFATSAKGTFTVLKINGATYFSADPTFWKVAGTGGNLGSAETAATFTGKYLKVGPDSRTLAALGVLCHPSQLAGPFSGQVSGMVERGYTTINGQKALHITDSADADGIYVSVSSNPELLRLDAGGNANLIFTKYNAPLNLSPPPANLTLDGKKYGF
jgi:hypothetical protein